MIEDTEMAKKTGKGNTPIVAVRLSAEIQDRLRAHAERLSKRTPGVPFTITDAIRSLLVDGLDKAEGRKRSKKGAS